MCARGKFLNQLLQGSLRAATRQLPTRCRPQTAHSRAEVHVLAAGFATTCGLACHARQSGLICDDGAAWDDSESNAAALWRRKWNPDWDGRAPAKPKEIKEGVDSAPEKKVKTQGRPRHLLLIAPAETKQACLTEIGKQQVDCLAKRLVDMSTSKFKDHHHEYKMEVSNIWTSSDASAQSTAKTVADRLQLPRPSIVDTMLDDGVPVQPSPQVLPRLSASKLLEDGARIEYAYRSHFHREIDHKALEKERKKKLTVDADAAKTAESEERAAPSDPIVDVIVCHGSVLQYFVLRALQLPPEAWNRLGSTQAYTGVTELVIQPSGSVKLVRMSDTGHLPPALRLREYA